MTCKAAKKPKRPMSAVDWIGIAGIALLYLFIEFSLGGTAIFSPGWANGWPSCVRFQTVLSAVITAWLSLVLMTTAAGAGAIVGFICALMRVGEKHLKRAYRCWLWIAAVGILSLSALIFRTVYSSVWNDFPNGYPLEQELFTPSGLVDKDGRVLRVPGK